MYSFVDHIDPRRAKDLMSQLNIEQMNWIFDDIEEEGQEFEEHYNKLDMSLVSKEENKKYKSDSHFQTRMRQKDKLLMNAAKNAFLQIQVAHIKTSANNDISYQCVTCMQKFPSQHAVDTHVCVKRWVCKTCNTNTGNKLNYEKHVKKGCKVYMCIKCFHTTYNSNRYKQHVKMCKTVVCEVCKKISKTLEGRRRHKRKCHSE